MIGCPPDDIATPSRIYSTLVGQAIQVDGACFSSREFVPLVRDEDDTLIFTTGTVHADCAVVQCGRVGLYCYESVDMPVTTIQVFQPLGFPSPYVVYSDNQTRCYHKPVFVKQVYENFGQYRTPTSFVYGSYALSVSDENCGSAYRYTRCNGVEELVVIYTQGTVHNTLIYDGLCYGSPVPLVQVGTLDLPVTGTHTSFVSGCSDPLCDTSGQNPSGNSVTYYSTTDNGTVLVAFNNLDYGIPRYGVAPEKEDSGTNKLTEGNVTLVFASTYSKQVIIPSAAGPGELSVTVVARGIAKRVIVTHFGTDTVYPLPSSESTVRILVDTGDRVSVDISVNKPNKTKLKAPVQANVSWKPIVARFRLYDTAILPTTGTTVINALGFCGMSNRSGYSFFGTLPVSDVTSYPNPDTHVTVTGQEAVEYRLVTCTAKGDLPPLNPFTDYAGQVLTGPLTFKFYSGRHSQGGHGEMDVWIDTDGTYPGYFKVNDYKALRLPDGWYKKTTDVGDTSRNALSVTDGTSAASFTSPGIFASSAGDQIIVGGFDVIPASVTFSGTTFNLTGTSAGLAYRILDNSQVS